MEKKFGLADDKYVGSVVFYVSSGKIYEDAAHSVLAKTDDIVHAFEMGTILLKDVSGAPGNMARPVSMLVSSGVAVVYATFSATSGAFTAVELTNGAE